MHVMEITHFEVFDLDLDRPEHTWQLPLSARADDPLTISDTARDCLRLLQALEVVCPWDFIRIGDSTMVTAVAERREVAA